MNIWKSALLWAGVILAVAFAGRVGLMPEDTAGTLVIVLPALAVVALYARRGCGACRSAGA